MTIGQNGGQPAPSGESDAQELEDCRRALTSARNESNQHLRSLELVSADLDNLRRRTAREVDDARRYAIGPLLESLLPVRDSLERGLGVPAPEAEEGAYRDGIALALREFDRVLAEFGVEVIDPQGLPFDPELHEAVSVEAGTGLPPDTVCRVFDKGYRLPGRLIRPARVSVAKPA